MKSEKGRIKISLFINLFLLVIIGIGCYYIWKIYKLNDFGNFTKAEYTSNLSFFSRDSEVKYSKHYSYKIDSPYFNDALIYRKIDVEPNCVYQVSAMVKYENVENEKNTSDAGVNIGIMDTTEKSASLVGNGDWQKLSFQFNSKDRTSVDIAFRLGAYDDNSRGKVWFSDFTIEKGKKKEDTNWNYICLIIKNIDVTLINGKRVIASLEDNEVKLIENNLKRFQNSMNEISRKQYVSNI